MKNSKDTESTVSAWRDGVSKDVAPAPWHAEALSTMLQKAESQRLPAGLLVLGPVGVGKTAFVRGFVKTLLCEQQQACGKCAACLQVQAGVHADLALLSPVEGKQSISVEAVRDFSHRIRLTGRTGTTRVGVIDPAEALTESAANALLKTLEEPPPGVLIVLLAHRLSVLSATIRSRCQILRLPAPDLQTAATWLQGQQPALDSAILPPLLSLYGPYQLLEALAQEEGAAADPGMLNRELGRLASANLDCVAMAGYWKTQGLELRLRWLFLAALDELRSRQSTGGDSSKDTVLSHLSLTSLRDLPKRCIQMLRELSTQQNPQALAESFLIRLHHDVMAGRSS